MENVLTAKQYFSLVDNHSKDMWELFRGILRMSPGPLSEHQKISGNIHLCLGNAFFRDERIHIRYAPYDVTLNENTVVQPDICVIDDISRETRRGYQGPPLAIIEILSASNDKYDKKDKFKLYEECGVLEYWIVDPWDKHVSVYCLTGGKYVLQGLYREKDKFVSKALFDLEVDNEEVFYRAL